MATSSVYTPLDPRIEVLDNGVTVILEHLPHVHSATVGLWAKTGSGCEEARLAGVSHFLEHLFFKGTELRSARELMDAIESKGGQMNAFTAREYTCLYVRCLDRHVHGAIEVLADVIKHPTFADFEKERRVILEEIASITDVPEEFVHDWFTERVWPDHPMGRPVTGSLESVSAMVLEDVRAYKKAWYCPENLIFVVVGNIEGPAVLDHVREEFGLLETCAAPLRPSAPRFAPGAEWFDRDIGQHHVLFAFPSPPITDERRYAYDLLGSILGGGSTSRLFDRVREEEGLAYSIYSYHASHLDAGMLGVYAAVAPENLERTLELCSEELRKLRDVPVPAKELDSNVEQLKGAMLLALESTFNRMMRLARSMIYFGRIISTSEIIEGIEAVTAEDVQCAAAELFTPEGYALGVLGPSNGAPPRLRL